MPAELGLVGVDGLSGAPSVGEDYTDRGDFRQSWTTPSPSVSSTFYPTSSDATTGYSDSPDGHRADRAWVGTGIRINTAF